MSVTKKLQTSYIPVYACWYEQDPDLLQFEKGLLREILSGI